MNWVEWVSQSPSRLPMPICAQAGTQLTGASVQDLVCNPEAQSEAELAMGEWLNLPILISAMDLSVEAEAFGCEVVFSANEIPSVVGRRIASQSDIAALSVPQVGEGRSSVGLEAVSRLKKHLPQTPILGCMIGPFSLVIRLVGASEALELTVSDPALIETILEKILPFQIAYARAFCQAGADGVILAEPAAGLLSPRAMRRFSSAYVRQLIKETQSDSFVAMLHNCGAKSAHLDALFESGAAAYHFGAPMNFAEAVSKAPSGCLIGGNLDPYAVFVGGSEAEVVEQTERLLRISGGGNPILPSSGCDLPAHTPLQNLRRFVETVREWDASSAKS